MQRCIGAESEWVLSGCRRGADVVQRREVVQRFSRGEGAAGEEVQVQRCRGAEVLPRCCRGGAEVVQR